jgi:hypothetical protein
MTMFRLLILSLAIFIAPDAWAHTQSYGLLSVTFDTASAAGRLELAVRDLDRLYDLDADQDGNITWGEFRRREAEITKASLGGIAIARSDVACALIGEPAMTDVRGGESYIVLPFRGTCPQATGPITLGYDLLFAGDAQHRGLVAVTTPEATSTFVMTPAKRRVVIEPAHADRLRELLTLVGHGAQHIWIGYDHILFLLTLLIGTFATRGSERPLRAKLYDAVKVVTAFTLSHSLTLGLAAFGVVRIPTALTESLIAVTITLAALNNVWPVVTRRLWMVAFGFGLVHGLGFANVLAELDLPRENLLAALFAFNLGVELGQLVILFAALPLIVLATRQWTFGRVALPAANIAIAAVGLMWLSDRSLGSSLLPF